MSDYEVVVVTKDWEAVVRILEDGDCSKIVKQSEMTLLGTGGPHETKYYYTYPIYCKLKSIQFAGSSFGVIT
jgi:hypothetical protein